MPDPLDNDPWADLYKDLGVEGNEKPKPKVAAHSKPAPLPEVEYTEEVLVEEGIDGDEADDPEGEYESDEAGEGDVPGEGSGSEDEPGTKKRRRRRRRRSKKKPGTDAPGDATEGEVTPIATRAPVAIMPDAETEGEFEDEYVEEEVAETVDSSVEEVSTEMTREMIANWNVPSWEEIVTGLYRPER